MKASPPCERLLKVASFLPQGAGAQRHHFLPGSAGLQRYLGLGDNGTSGRSIQSPHSGLSFMQNRLSPGAGISAVSCSAELGLSPHSIPKCLSNLGPLPAQKKSRKAQ